VSCHAFKAQESAVDAIEKVFLIGTKDLVNPHILRAMEGSWLKMVLFVLVLLGIIAWAVISLLMD
jgi:hypothetical protein